MGTQNTILIIICLLSFLVFTSTTIAADDTAAKSSKTIYKTYLKTACNTTSFPKLCYSSLSPYVSKIQTNNLNLFNSALTVALNSAKKTYSLLKSISKKKYLTKIDASVLKDCAEEVGDSIEEIKQSLESLETIMNYNSNGTSSTNYYSKEYEISNIKTWMSAAITDETTCTDEIEEMDVSESVKNKMKKSILNFHSLTTNALALVNKLSYY
ncbi:Plant invertase/pectin methylesterase inhibitor superfamily protein [Euphorbia peplus]|nr:Plant invertase/pectin methylesterase inhibitor superfamily protein [Euphorbia peplus]